MTEKAKKGSDQRKHIITVKGDFHVKGDFINGDKNSIHYQISNIQSLVEFVTELHNIHLEIAQLKQGYLSRPQLRNIENVEVNIQDALEKAQKPIPVGEEIHTTLREAKETMELLSGSLEAAMRLGANIGTLALLALQVFGG